MASGRTRKSRPKRVVSLARRLRNPPPTFLGREADVELVHAAMRRGHLVVVWGPAGLGKTSLIEQAIFSLGEEAIARTLSFTVSAGDESGAQLGFELLGALRDLVGERRLPRVDLDDVADFCAAVIDLADSVDAIVVIDDAHNAGPGIVSELCATAASYARSSRFVVSSRADLAIVGEPQSIALGPLPEAAMFELARAWSRGLPEREARAAARDAEGSPFWLKQRLAAGRGTGAALRSALLEGLDPDAAEWLALLARLELALPVAALDGACPGRRSLTEIAGELEARGLVERSSEGIRIHGGARSVLSIGGDVAKAHKGLARSLMAANVPGASLEALRLLLADGDERAAATLLHGELDGIIAAGLAPRLWQVLARTPSDRYASAKLRAAVEVGGKAARWAARLPRPARRRDQLAWVKSLAYAGRMAEAAEASEDLARALAPESAVAFDAMFFGVRCLVTLGDGPAALSRARYDWATTPEQRALLRGWSARACILAEDDRAALEIVDDLHAGLDSLEEATRRDVQIQRAIVLADLGRVSEARAALDDAGSDVAGSPDLRDTQRRLVRQAKIAVETGELAEAERLASVLLPRAVGSFELTALLEAIELRIAVVRGDAPRTSPVGTSPLARAVAEWELVLQHGSQPSPATGTTRVDVATVQRIAASHAALLRGDHERAREHALAAVSLADAYGLTLWGLEARLAHADALLVLGSPEVEEIAATLAAFDDRARSPRFACEARFLRAIAGREPDIASLDALARSRVAVAATRRSRALFGSEEPLDRVDREVLAALRQRLRIAHVRAGAGYRVGLLLDTRNGRAKLPDGVEVELGGKPLCMKLLLALFEHGGTASKGDLVRAAWARPDYHPLRDDKRLQVAIGRLRNALGDDLADPQLIQTTADGYRFPPKLAVHRL